MGLYVSACVGGVGLYVSACVRAWVGVGVWVSLCVCVCPRVAKPVYVCACAHHGGVESSPVRALLEAQLSMSLMPNKQPLSPKSCNISGIPASKQV